MGRQFYFENAPLVPREQLPLHLQPQNSIRGKVINYINGIDPRIPHGQIAQKSNQVSVINKKLEGEQPDEEENKQEVELHELDEAAKEQLRQEQE